MKTNAPTILKAEALSSARSGGNNKPKEGYSRCLGSEEQVKIILIRGTKNEKKNNYNFKTINKKYKYI
jgi:hypothetical protein